MGTATETTRVLREDDPLLSVAECSRQLGGISKWTIYAWLTQGKLRRSKVGARTMIRASELAKMVRE